jgi:hyperosmotically inducible protein
VYATVRKILDYQQIIPTSQYGKDEQIMRTKLATSLFVIGAMLIGVTTQAQNTDREHPLTFIKDSAITTKVKAKLADEKMNTLMHITVDTDDHGIVVLSGNVRSKELAERALSIARHTEGVTNVRNHIQIRAGD